MERVAALAAAHPAAIVLREKDLSAEEYRQLAIQVMALCKRENTPCILHSFWSVAEELKADGLHLPLPLLRELSGKQRRSFPRLGTSCHSVEEALEAKALGCTYIMAGHVFATDCKRGLPGRGLSFLQQVCRAVDIPVYAIGGIEVSRTESVLLAGAKGVCMMSGCMQCEDVAALLREFESD